ncbi:response regulator transcription factor [Microvirga sp. BSC39]|uniref:response regulator transcription factor n=1 Tax=Microvirga sp. BSC39 TaxID=1549810 RepID=UPI0009DEB9A9|nr:response regulator transcription factor [Microvirga sp. BSC39]
MKSAAAAPTQKNEFEHNQGLSAPRPCVATILVSENVLMLAGLRQLLEGTCFAMKAMTGGLPSNDQSHELSNPILFIIDANNSTQQAAETISYLRAVHPTARMVVIRDSFEPSFLIKIGKLVDGFCQTRSNRDALIKSLELVMLGEPVLPSGLINALLTHTANGSTLLTADGWMNGTSELHTGNVSEPHLPKLSSREVEILRYLTHGASNKLIARKLDVGETTIKVHLRTILRKIGASNRTQAAMWAAQRLPPTAGHIECT